MKRILPHRYSLVPNRKPAYNSLLRIDRKHPLAHGLVSCWLLNESGGNKICDISGNQNYGVINGVSQWVAGEGGLLDLNGNSGYVNCGDGVDLPNAFSLLVRIGFNNLPTPNGVLIAKCAANGSQRQFSLFVDVNGALIFSRSNVAGSLYHNWTTASTPISAGAYFDIALTVSDNSIDEPIVKMYANGIEYANSKTLDQFTGGANTSVQDTRIGCLFLGFRHIDGRVGHLCIYNRALSVAEIAQLYREPYCFILDPMARELGLLYPEVAATPSIVYQGAWQSSYYQGAWQQQAQELTRQTDENIAVADAVSVSIKPSSDENIAVADSLTVVLKHTEPESIAVQDAQAAGMKHTDAENIEVQDAQAVLIKHTEAESIGVADMSIAGQHIILSEQIEVADSVSVDIIHSESEQVNVSDSVLVDIIHSEPEQIKVSDSLGVKIIASQSENIAVSDQLTVVIQHEESENIGVADAVSTGNELATSEHIAVSDALSVVLKHTDSEHTAVSDALSAILKHTDSEHTAVSDALSVVLKHTDSEHIAVSDALSVVLKHTEAEDVAVSDSQSHTLESAIQDPTKAAEAFTGTISSGRKRPRQGVKQVGTSADPILAVTTSSNATTFTKTSVTDATAWDLSRVEAGYILVTGDGYSGVVQSTQGNTVNVNSWVRSGIDRRGLAEDKPDDGLACTVHIAAEGQMISIRANSSNTGSMYLAFASDVNTENGHPIVSRGTGSEVTISSVHGQKLDLTRIWVVAPTSQKADWILDGYSVDGKLLWAGEEAAELIQHTVSEHIAVSDALIVVHKGAAQTDEHIAVSDSLSVAALESKVLNPSLTLYTAVDLARIPMVEGGASMPFDGMGNYYGTGGQTGVQYAYCHHHFHPFVIGRHYRTFIKFSLGAIPPHAILKKAELRVGVKKTESKDGIGLLPATLGEILVHLVHPSTPIDKSIYETPTDVALGSFIPEPMSVREVSATAAVAACWPPPGFIYFSFRPSNLPGWELLKPDCWADFGDQALNWCWNIIGTGGTINVEERFFLDVWGEYMTRLVVWYIV